jgi:hypothetical protein
VIRVIRDLFWFTFSLSAKSVIVSSLICFGLRSAYLRNQ